jgi:AraC-like DNA-binding protein
MDIHDTTEATVEDVAADHQRDFALQDDFNCKFIYFWHDIPNNTGFCVFEAPEKDCVINLHNASHGHTPNQIIEVELGEVESFLGKVAEIAWNKKNLPFEGYISKTAHRAIMSLEINNSIFLKLQINKDKFAQTENLQKKFINDSLLKFEGNKVSWENGNVLISFLSEENAINCAADIQHKFSNLVSEENSKTSVSIGLNFGAPVTKSDDLFGDVISLARKLGYIAGENKILISSSLAKAYNAFKLKTGLKNGFIKVVSSRNEQFINKLFDTLEKKWNLEDFTIDSLVKQFGMSRAQLYRRFLDLTGRSPNIFIREVRLKNALKMIEEQKGSISEVAYGSGFNNPSYFSRCFFNKYGIQPSEYAHKIV